MFVIAQNDYKVWNLLDPDEARGAVEHVEEQIEQASSDLDLIRQAEKAMMEIEDILHGMRLLARQSAQEGADREAMQEKFAKLRHRLDRVADEYREHLSADDADRLRRLLDSLAGEQE